MIDDLVRRVREQCAKTGVAFAVLQADGTVAIVGPDGLPPGDLASLRHHEAMQKARAENPFAALKPLPASLAGVECDWGECSARAVALRPFGAGRFELPVCLACALKPEG